MEISAEYPERGNALVQLRLEKERWCAAALSFPRYVVLCTSQANIEAAFRAGQTSVQCHFRTFAATLSLAAT